MPSPTDVFTMVAISDLSKKLLANHPDITLVIGDEFVWSPSERTITYNPSDEDAAGLLLHELGHAELGHGSYSRDVELVAMEVDAWQKARALAPSYEVKLDEDRVEDHLDTYREWLHSRSLCPACEATGLQTSAQNYRCLACSHEWRVNEARVCALRRYSLK